VLYYLRITPYESSPPPPKNCPGGAALPVLQAPKGVSLGEAVASISPSMSEDQRFVSSKFTGGTSPSLVEDSNRNQDAVSPIAFTPTTELTQVLDPEESTDPHPALTPWQALLIKLSRGSVSLRRTSPPPDSHSGKSILPPPSCSRKAGTTNYFTPPPTLLIPEIPEDPDKTEGIHRTIAQIDPLSPLPLLTPGAPDSVPIEAKAQVVTKLWPILAPFAPNMLRQSIMNPTADIAENRPTTEQFPAAVAVADISGFTALTQALSREGPIGVDLLAKCLNSYFSQLMDLVLSKGGDVSKFAGDALLLLFVPTPEEVKSSPEDRGLSLATLRASKCMKDLVERFGTSCFLLS